MTSADGARTGFRSAGTVALTVGKVEASHEQNMQNEETKANCTMVSVAGLSKVVRMDLEEVFVRTDEAYHSTQRI